MICEFCPEGFTQQGSKKCKGIVESNLLEICGDGMNLGEYECDDGNLENGDGCSSKCKVEFGYKCTSRKSLPDICVDI